MHTCKYISPTMTIFLDPRMERERERVYLAEFLDTEDSTLHANHTVHNYIDNVKHWYSIILVILITFCLSRKCRDVYTIVYISIYNVCVYIIYMYIYMYVSGKSYHRQESVIFTNPLETWNSLLSIHAGMQVGTRPWLHVDTDKTQTFFFLNAPLGGVSVLYIFCKF